MTKRLIMNFKDEIVVLIPAYEPDSKLVSLIKDLTKKDYTKILVVDDGSTVKSDLVFKEIANYQNVKIIKHYVNQGKGRALKTGFNTILNEYTSVVGCVTADADGQHTPRDIDKCSRELFNNPENLVLGVRDFNTEEIPLRSEFGNKMTKIVLNLLLGININDTQTGLRAMSLKNMENFMHTEGENYEYEMNMLVDTKELDINITEVPIQTVYINENETSHFNPILDSIRIYSVFLKYILSSLSSAVLDIALFAISVRFLSSILPKSYILVSTIFARLISTLFNYKINSNKVFNKKNLKKGSFYRYITLATVQMFASAALVLFISQFFKWNPTLTKVFVDGILFFISFVIQRELVFVTEDE